MVCYRKGMMNSSRFCLGAVMSKAKILCFVFWSAAMSTPRAQATTTASFVPVPISAEALADDPNLANYQSWDVQVGLPAGDRWAATDIRAVLTVGKFYIPPAHDSNIIQPSQMNTPGSRYLQFDTMVMRPIFDPGTQILGGSTFSPDPNNPEFPSNGHNLNDPSDPNGTMFVPANDQMIVDADYWDPQAPSRTYTTPATYTVARLTFLNGAAGQVQVRFRDTQTPPIPLIVTFVIPEPSTGAMLLLAGAVAARRQPRGAKAESKQARRSVGVV
jgi:hypothetical protein